MIDFKGRLSKTQELSLWQISDQNDLTFGFFIMNETTLSSESESFHLKKKGISKKRENNSRKLSPNNVYKIQ